MDLRSTRPRQTLPRFARGKSRAAGFPASCSDPGIRAPLTAYLLIVPRSLNRDRSSALFRVRHPSRAEERGGGRGRVRANRERNVIPAGSIPSISRLSRSPSRVAPGRSSDSSRCSILSLLEFSRNEFFLLSFSLSLYLSLLSLVFPLFPERMSRSIQENGQARNSSRSLLSRKISKCPTRLSRMPRTSVVTITRPGIRDE